MQNLIIIDLIGMGLCSIAVGYYKWQDWKSCRSFYKRLRKDISYARTLRNPKG